MLKKLGTPLVFTSVILFPMVFSTSSAEAAYIATYTQVGSNVLETGHGSINTTGFNFEGQFFTSPPQTAGGLGFSELGNATFPYSQDYYFTTITGATSFGTTTTLGALASVGSGSLVTIFAAPANPANQQIAVPHGYVAGADLGTSNDIYNNQTFASLGLVPGTYAYSFGSGRNFDTFLIQIIQPSVAVPEPTPFLLLSIGLLGLTAASYRRKS